MVMIAEGKVDIKNEGTPAVRIFKVQRTCMYDGPGIRTTLFFQGCNLRCKWCQNPESQSFQSDTVLNMNLDEIIETVMRDKAYYDATNGGVTLSGGEPFMQKPEHLIPLLKELKRNGIHITAETSLHAPWSNIYQASSFVDLFLVDLKAVGDNELHNRLTGQEFHLILENIKKLLELQKAIQFRMVIVPGLNDSEDVIKATAEFLKSIGFRDLELLKYHNLYEAKAKKMGLIQETLNIGYEQSVEAVKRAIELFKQYGINAYNWELESVRKPAVFTDRVKKIQEDIRSAPRALCMDSAMLKTRYYKKSGWKKSLYIHRAECLKYILEHKKIKIYDDELIAGNFTSKRVAGQMWCDYYGLMDILFLYRINRQKPHPFQCSLWERLKFYFYIFPNWLNHNILRFVYPNWFDFLVAMAKNSELTAGFNNNLAAIAHFIVNFERILKLGTIGLKEEVKQYMKENPKNNQKFYQGCLIALDGLEAFGLRYAAHLEKMAKKEANPARKAELEEMSRICAKVPKYPAETFHEALQSMMLTQIALCQESYENAISFGRLDQILYPYYKKDVEAGRITYEKAKELLCLFMLKIDECILVNDGNSFLSMSKLFETVSTDQAVTYGGVDKDGNDATNDVTYMLIEAGELNTVSLDLSARVHKGSPDKYMERIAQAYLNGSPIPQVHSDETYIAALMKHYPCTIEQARNYSIVGCVEPNASDNHFGNTDCANVSLPMPFLQALKGQDYDLWNMNKFTHLIRFQMRFLKFIFNERIIFSKYVNRFCDYILYLTDYKRGVYRYKPAKTMDELLERFQARLNAVTQSILSDHQKIEKQLRTHFVTLLASSLFPACLKNGKDVYEGGCDFNSSGIQAVGVTDVADSFHAIEEVVFKKKLFTIPEIIIALEQNFQGEKNQRIRKALLEVPKFGEDSSQESIDWMNRVLDMYNKALDSVGNVPRNGRYSAGYYALNVCNRYGRNTPALPSGRLAGVPLANSITPHYGMPANDLLSAMNSISKIDFVEHAENGTTATLHIDSALFQGPNGVKNLAAIFKTYLTTGGMQLQPNVINREILLEAYHNPEKHPYLLVRIAGYCEYFNALSDEMKRIIINRTLYS